MSRTARLAAFAAAIILSVVGSSQDRAHARAEVAFSGYPVGTVVVKTGQRRLYLVVRDGRAIVYPCLLYTSQSPRDGLLSRMPSSA